MTEPARENERPSDDTTYQEFKNDFELRVGNHFLFSLLCVFSNTRIYDETHRRYAYCLLKEDMDAINNNEDIDYSIRVGKNSIIVTEKNLVGFTLHIIEKTGDSYTYRQQEALDTTSVFDILLTSQNQEELKNASDSFRNEWKWNGKEGNDYVYTNVIRDIRCILTDVGENLPLQLTKIITYTDDNTQAHSYEIKNKKIISIDGKQIEGDIPLPEKFRWHTTAERFQDLVNREIETASSEESEPQEEEWTIDSAIEYLSRPIDPNQLEDPKRTSAGKFLKQLYPPLFGEISLDVPIRIDKQEYTLRYNFYDLYSDPLVIDPLSNSQQYPPYPPLFELRRVQIFRTLQEDSKLIGVYGYSENNTISSFHGNMPRGKVSIPEEKASDLETAHRYILAQQKIEREKCDEYIATLSEDKKKEEYQLGILLNPNSNEEQRGKAILFLRFFGESFGPYDFYQVDRICVYDRDENGHTNRNKSYIFNLKPPYEKTDIIIRKENDEDREYWDYVLTDGKITAILVGDKRTDIPPDKNITDPKEADKYLKEHEGDDGGLTITEAPPLLADPLLGTGAEVPPLKPLLDSTLINPKIQRATYLIKNPNVIEHDDNITLDGTYVTKIHEGKKENIKIPFNSEVICPGKYPTEEKGEVKKVISPMPFEAYRLSGETEYLALGDGKTKDENWDEFPKTKIRINGITKERFTVELNPADRYTLGKNKVYKLQVNNQKIKEITVVVGDNFRNPEKICCKAAPGTVFTIIYKNGNSLDDETIAKIQNNSSPGIVIKKPEITHVGDGERRERGERLVK